MGTRATIYIHKREIRGPKSEYIVKLYQHYDGYIDGLGVNLVRGFKGYTQYEFDYYLKRADYFHQHSFEITEGIHGDTEFSYHIYRNGADLEITVQEGYGDEDILNQKEIVLYSIINGEEYMSDKVKDYILDQELYNIQQWLRGDNISEMRNGNSFGPDYIFSKRFEIDDIVGFKDLVENEIKAYYETDNQVARKGILLLIKEQIGRQKELEKGKYFKTY